MKKLASILLLLCALFALGQAFSQRDIAFIKSPQAAAQASFSDDFNRADNDSLGANWVEQEGDTDISANRAQFITGAFAKNLAIYTATSCNTVNQYVKFTVAFSAGVYLGAIFRYTDSSSAFYGLQVGTTEDLAYWTYYTDSAATSTDITNGALTVNDGDSFGVTISGTGNGTVLRIWRNPTANAPTAADTWDGGAATVTFTTDPPNPKDTGNYIGIEGYSSAGGDVNIDNFYAGDIP